MQENNTSNLDNAEIDLPKQSLGLCRTLSVIAGKFKTEIIYFLLVYKPAFRFNEFRRCLPNASVKVLTSALRELEEDGLIIRTEYQQIPPKVEYSLSELGKSIEPVIMAIHDWGEQHMGDYRGKYKDAIHLE